MSHLILIRHSVSQPISGVSAHQWELTEEGSSRCAVLADHLRPYRITRIATSDEPKARATADLLSRHLRLNTQAIIDPDFRETRRDTVPYYDNQIEFHDAIRSAMINPQQRLFGEESFADARLRLVRALFALVSAYPDETLAAVTHGTIMSMLIGHVSGSDPYNTWKKLGMPAYAILTPNLDLLDLKASVM